MGKAKILIPTVCFLFVLGFYSAGAAVGQYKISTTIIDMGQVCYIYGTVTDASGNAVYPAEVTFACGAIRTKVAVLPGGIYMDNPPPCSDYTITATAPGRNPKTVPDVNVVEDELSNVDLSFAPDISLADAVSALRIICGMGGDPIPVDCNRDKRVGIEDAVCALQALGELTKSASSPRVVRMLLSAGEPKTVTVWKDSDGDGVEEFVRQLTTDAYGYIEIDDLSNGAYSLTAASPDNAGSVRVENILIAGRDIQLNTIRLKPPGSISGVVALEGEADHSGIHVYIPGTSFDGYTDSAGNFALSDVAEGTYDVRAAKADFGTITQRDIPVHAETDTNIEAFMLPSSTGGVNGTARLQDYPYTGIIITLRKDIGTTYVTTTDENGNYAFADVPFGDYRLSAVMPGYVPREISLVVVQNKDNPQPDLFLPKNNDKGDLAGRVTLGKTTDHTGIVVSLAGTEHLALTDEAGAYTITGIPEGAYTVFMKSEAYIAEKVKDVTIESGKTTTLSPTELATAFGTANGSIAGRAFYLGEVQHNDITIGVEPNPYTTSFAFTTDTRGGFIIKDVPSGTYTLSFANFPAYKTVHRRGVYVPPWGTTFIRPVMMIQPKGSVRGEVVVEGSDPGDDVYADVDVYAAYSEGTSPPTHPLQTRGGRFLLENVKEGLIEIKVTKPGYNHASVSNVRIIPGQTTIITDPIELNRPCPPPTGIEASQASGSSAEVNWTASDCSDLAGYNVYYGTGSNPADYTKVNAGPATGEKYEVTGLGKGTTYYFAVEAMDKDGLAAPRAPADGTCKWTIRPKNTGFVFCPGCTFENSPFDIALVPDGSKGYVSLKYGGPIFVIDFSGDDPEVTGQINIPGSGSRQPTALALSPNLNELYVVDRLQNALFVVGTLDDSIDVDPVLVGAVPKNVIVSPDGSKIYVCSDNDEITVIDAAKRSMDEPIPLGQDADPYGMAIAHNKFYVAGTVSTKVYIIDIDSESSAYHTVVDHISPGIGLYDAIARTDGAYVYFSHDTLDGMISVVDTSTDELETPILIKNQGESNSKNPRGMAISGNILYVVNSGDSTVTMIDTKSNTKLVLDSPLASGGNNPENLAVSPDGNRLYIADSFPGSVEVMAYSE